MPVKLSASGKHFIGMNALGLMLGALGWTTVRYALAAPIITSVMTNCSGTGIVCQRTTRDSRGYGDTFPLFESALQEPCSSDCSIHSDWQLGTNGTCEI